jgi:hypothetical protein
MFRQLTKRHIAALAIGFTTLAVVGGMELPADAHTAAVTTTQSVCIAPGAWKVTLGVNPTNLEAHPVATIINSAGPYTVHTFPYTTSFTYQTAHANLRVTILWDDGVTYDSGQLVVQAPPGSCEPITVPTNPPPVTPPTTTCAAAVPPRTDCTPATTVPVIIAPPVTVTNPPTSPPDTVMPPTSSPVTSAPHAPPAVVHSSSTTVATVLPHTGAGDTAGMVVAALFAIFLGWVLVYSVKRRGVS